MLCSAIQETLNCLSLPSAEIPHFLQLCLWDSLGQYGLGSSGACRAWPEDPWRCPITFQHLIFLLLEAEKKRKPLLTQISKGQPPFRGLTKCFKKTAPCQCLGNCFPTSMAWATVTFLANEWSLQLWNGCIIFWLEQKRKFTFLFLALILHGFDLFLFMWEVLCNVEQYLPSYVTVLASWHY